MHPFRQLRHNPAFALTAILILAAGIAASTAVFSAADALLLHPLPYPHSEQLVSITKTMPSFELFRSDASALDFIDYRDGSHSFAEMAAIRTNSVNLTGEQRATRVSGLSVTPNFFALLGAKPLLGRTFAPDEEHVAILSKVLWRDRFGAARNILGRKILLDSESYTVIGVVEPMLQFIDPSDIYVPLRFEARDLQPNQRGHQNIDVIARLKPGVTLEQARADMRVNAQSMTRRMLNWYPADWSINVDPLSNLVAGDLRTPLLVLLAAVGLVLLIACANVANLLLARATSRYREIGVRTALGATRGQIATQLLAESSILALLAGMAGLAGGAGLLYIFARFSPSGLLHGQSASMNPVVAAFSLALAMATTFLFGLVPAIVASGIDPIEALRSGGRSASAGVRVMNLRGILVAAEVALSLVLLIGAGLLVRSFDRLAHASPGFNPTNLFTARIAVSTQQYRSPYQVAAFYNALLDRAAMLPGVQSAALGTGTPFGSGGGGGSFNIVGRPWPQGAVVPDVERRTVTTQFFGTLSVPLLQGRLFSNADGDGAPKVAIINDPLAKAYFPKGDAIGQQITAGSGTYRVVGIVGAVKDRSLLEPSRPTIYLEARQATSAYMNLMLRTTGDPLSQTNAVRQIVHALDSNVPVYKIASMDQLMADSLARRKLSTALLAILATFAMALAGLGIYGLMAYAVAQRIPEIGIRMALGAEAGSVRAMVLRQAMQPVLAGMAVGLVAAVAFSRALASLLYQVKTTDPATFLAVPALLVIIAAFAAYIPGRRATNVDPAIALRSE